ncbi:MAG: hypothetical protein AUJ28_00025 [Parcubacteria group bacterium CG1_02_37_51]|uniref:DUF3784 domain-containing protein n=2 Tax=Candidatus Komeiliibacteriota TaxID=1817908 RepID=A0A2M8DRA1_9BACT|nr:MAG: hypothetical protein AUJ28_00025 [Parcubacteria group bacterium CG1_02_37_51]PIY95199.1 MAG: hypothetical protein COY67_01190 [Candidatus Komeilibacteria bacterium CG_4_10_14_0_8_um_filter_37_78]PJC01919.1 MAG: hypothetical protein CO073_02220 [Candidatus Komeilibacteria bacterium CG_4_9_14_0_8_um_filter_36_9]
MKIIIGLLLLAGGVLIIWKTEPLFRFFGRVAFTEKYLGTEGGSRLFYKLLGLVIIFFGLLMVTEQSDGFLEGTIGKVFNRY